MYAAGQGVTVSYPKAFSLLSKAASAGHPMALANLGVLYESGSGVARDPVLAHTMYSLAVKGGYAAAAQNRDTVQATLTEPQLREARLLAARWKPGTALPTKTRTGK